MQPIFPIKNSFSAGQVSRKLYGRSDLEVYNSGVEISQNFFPDVRGPAIKRGGSGFIETITVAAGTHAIRTFVRQFSQSTFFIFSFHFHSIRITEHSASDPLTIVSSQSIATTYSDTQVKDIRLVHVPESLTTYILHGNHIPRKLAYSGGTWTYSTPGWAMPTHAWTSAGYPTVGVFHQGRLWLSGSAQYPEYLWGSVVSSYEDFTVASTATGAIEQVLTAIGVVKWMASQNTLLVGTEFGEYIIFATNTTLVYNDIHALPQSQYGGKFCRVAMLGDQVAYVTADGKKIQTLNYQFQQNTWLSKDATFYSDDLTQDYGIVDIAWAQNPDYLLWMLLEDGSVLTMSYERARDIIGWAPHSFAYEVKSLDVAILNGKAHVVMAQEHGNDKMDIVLYDYDNYLDNSTSVTTGMPVNSVSGLDRYNGETVDVLVDGAVHPQVVVSGGVATLAYAAQSSVHVGKAYTSRLKTLPFDQFESGVSKMAYKKRFAEIYLRMYNSSVPLINGRRPADRSVSTPMGTPEPLLTGDVKVINAGRDRFAQVEIVHSLPLPCNVVAIFGKIAAEAL